MLVQRAQLFRTRSTALQQNKTVEPPEGKIPDFLSVEKFPPLTWVVEDFVQKMPDSVTALLGSLETYLAASTVRGAASPTEQSQARAAQMDGVAEDLAPEEAHGSNFLTDLFRDVRVHTLFLPATSREQLQDLSRLTPDQLTPEFRDEVSKLRNHITRGLLPRQFRGKQVTGPVLAKELRFVVQGLQKGMLQELPSLWRSWVTQVEEVSLNDADALFAKLAQSFDDKAADAPVPIATFNRRLDEAREQATTFYKLLIRDFHTAPRGLTLRKRLEGHVRIVSATYHDRIRRWVADLAATTKERFGKTLAARTLPADPGTVETQGKAKLHEIADNFSATLKLQGAPAGGSWLGIGTAATITVPMPPFSHDPATQLAADLRAQLASHVLENDRAVQQLFKRAVAVADGVFDGTLNASNGRLLNGKQLTEIQNKAENLCWQAFERELSGQAWVSSSPEYKHHRLLLREEHLKGRKARLVAANEQLLNSAFRAHVDRLIGQYANSVSRMGMPVPVDVVDAEHLRIASVAQTSFASALQNFSDTTAFSKAKDLLKTALEEGLVHTREKNYEFWKVQSDQVTRCAVRLNKAAERDCGFLCLFLTVPWAHKATSRRHLDECFKQASAGSRLSSSLQNNVFEIWYKKDLGHDAERVATRCYALMWTLAVLLGGLAITCCCTGGYAGAPYYYGQQAIGRHQQPWHVQSCSWWPSSWWPRFSWRPWWLQWQSPPAAQFGARVYSPSLSPTGGYIDYGYAGVRPDARAKAAFYPGAGYGGAYYEDQCANMRGGFRSAGG
jgi:hypothetical protein